MNCLALVGIKEPHASVDHTVDNTMKSEDRLIGEQLKHTQDSEAKTE